MINLDSTDAAVLTALQQIGEGYAAQVDARSATKLKRGEAIDVLRRLQLHELVASDGPTNRLRWSLTDTGDDALEAYRSSLTLDRHEVETLIGLALAGEDSTAQDVSEKVPPQGPSRATISRKLPELEIGGYVQSRGTRTRLTWTLLPRARYAVVSYRRNLGKAVQLAEQAITAAA